MAGVPVLMVVLVPGLWMQNQNEALPALQPGDRFFSDPDYVPGLVAAGQAEIAPPVRPTQHRGTMWCARAGLGKGTANSSP